MNFGKWIGAVALLISLLILWRLRQVLLLLFVAIILAMVLNRFVKWLQNLGLQRRLAIALSVTTFLVLLAGFIVRVIPPFVDQLQNFILLLPETIEEIQAWVERLQDRIPGEWTEDLRLLELLRQQLQPLISRALNDVFIWISDILAIVVKLILILVLGVMLLANPQQYRRPFIRLFPAFYRSRIDDILSQCEVDLVDWMMGTFTTMVIVSILSGLGLWILRVPLGLASALWAGFCELIPNIGYIVAMLPLLAIVLLDAPWKALPVIILYFLIQQLESYVIIPWIMKQHVSLPPAATLLSQIVFASFFGFLGLFLALPLMIISKIWLREVVVKDVLDQWQLPQKAIAAKNQIDEM